MFAVCEWCVTISDKSILGGKSRGDKVIDCLSHYVCGEFVVARNGLDLLEISGWPHPLSTFKCGYCDAQEQS